MRKNLIDWADDLANIADAVRDETLDPRAASAVIRAADAVTRIAKVHLDVVKLLGGRPEKGTLKLIGLQRS